MDIIVMLNHALKQVQGLRFQHLTKSMGYETLKQVQGDKNGLFQQSQKDYLTHFQLVNKILTHGGLLATDNAVDLRDVMRDFIEYVENNSKFQAELVRIGNGVELVRKI